MRVDNDDDILLNVGVNKWYLKFFGLLEA
jgi:hypothetical protein